MSNCQAQSLPLESIDLVAQRLGPLPIINHFIKKLGLEVVLGKFLPPPTRRHGLAPAKAIGVLLRSILVEREPIYRQQETVATFDPSQFGLEPDDLPHLNDDAIGRALDRLYDADRGSLLTEVVVATAKTFKVSFDELHNDSTSISFCGQYRQATGRSIRGKQAPFVTYGHSKDHRPDLKQLLFILTTSRDGAIPVQFRCESGNRNDSPTHIATWDALVEATGQKDFLYVADSKLCSFEATEHIDNRGGRFVCVMPRSRQEDKQFRKWLQTNQPNWERVVDRRNRRRKTGPRDRWYVFKAEVPSIENWNIIWVYSELLKLRQGSSRQTRLTKAMQQLSTLNDKLQGPRPRTRARQELQERVEKILRKNKVGRYLKIQIVPVEEHRFRQVTRGRPGPNTQYVRKTRKRWRLEWKLDQETVEYDKKSDGMYPLLTNDRALSPADVLRAHKRQPSIEKRFEQTKTVFELAPVLLKNEGRVEALFFLYFLVLLIQALLERQIRLGMREMGLKELALYPEERMCRRPTAEQIFRLFSHTHRHVLLSSGQVVWTKEPELTDLQREVLGLLSMPSKAYQGR
jgi:transposase